MKLKLYIALFLLPLSVFAARTNDFDFLNINNNVSVGGKISISPARTLVPTAFVHAASTNVANDVLFFGDNYGANNLGIFVGRRARGTFTAPTAVQLNDVLSTFNGRGYGTTGFSSTSRAAIGMHAEEAWTDTATGTSIRFSTTTNGTITLVEHMRISDSGFVGIGTTAPTTPLHVVGTSTLAGNIVLGANSSSAITINAATASIPNNLLLGSLFLPSASSGSSTNSYSTNQINGDLFVLRGIMSSNLVVTTTTGTSSVSSGTNLTFTIDAAGGVGTLITQGLFTMQTNTLTAALPVINTIYTNNASRMMVNATMAIPTGVATISGSALWSVSGNTTNITSGVTGSTGVAGAVTNTVMGMVQPNALYMVTNINVGAGAPSFVQGMYRETRF